MHRIYCNFGSPPAGMLSSCFCTMNSDLFENIPSTTNAVESYNRFGKSTQRQPLKIAMMATYREDMARCLEIMASRKGYTTTYECQSNCSRKKRASQHNKARQKRLRRDCDDPECPPDTKRKFKSSMYCKIIII